MSDFMTEPEARALADEINLSRYPGWTAYPERHPAINSFRDEWRVVTHHVNMGATDIQPASSREEWDAAHQKWGD